MTATPKQQSFILSLIDERDIEPTIKGVRTVEDIKAGVPSLDKAQASRYIERLLELPKKATAKAQPSSDLAKLAESIPAGHYAVTGEDGTTDFYRVDKPTKGKWAGYVFVKLQLSETYERVSQRNTATILQKIIDSGPEAAAKRYGHELGKCAICSRTLTNPDSIERGIGPVCAGKSGWSF